MKSIRRISAPLVVLLAFVSAAAAAAPAKKGKTPPAKATPSAGKHSVPHLAPGELWVSSIPAGLEVRIGESPAAGKVVGRTPVVVKAADVGTFVTVVLLKDEYGADLPPQSDLGDFTGKSSHSAVHQEGGKEEDYLRAITYEVKLAARQTLIALFQPRSLPLSQAARLFPAESNFAFADADVSKTLSEKGVAAASIPEALDLLHRGGKVLLRGAGRNWLVAEVTSPNVVEVADLQDMLARRRTPNPTPERKP